jgi:hypothetical protein
MSEAEEISGEIVKRGGEVAVTSAAADMRYTDDSAVARVFVRVEYADGRIREYQAKEPQDFQVSDGMTMRQSRARFSAGGIFTPLTNAVATLRLSFTAHPRWNIHIRTEATAPADFEGISYR